MKKKIVKWFFTSENMRVTSEKEEEEAHDECVSKVEERADKSFNLKLGRIEVDAVDEEVDCCESTRHE